MPLGQGTHASLLLRTFSLPSSPLQRIDHPHLQTLSNRPLDIPSLPPTVIYCSTSTGREAKYLRTKALYQETGTSIGGAPSIALDFDGRGIKTEGFLLVTRLRP